VHYDTIIQHKPTKFPRFKLMLEFDFWRLLNVSNHTVLLMMNPWGSKHTGHVKGRIKALILKSTFRWFMLHNSKYTRPDRPPGKIMSL